MSCHEVQRRLEAYVDGLAEVEERETIRAHLASCATCRAEAALIDEVEARAREAFLADEPSDALRRRVDAVVERELAPGSARQRQLGGWRAAAAAAAVLLAVLGATLGGLGSHPTGTTRTGVVTASIEELRTFIDSARPLDVASRDPQALRRWFESKLAFAPPTPPGPARLELVGGRLCFFLDRRIAAYMYVADDRVVSLYVMPEAGLGRADGEPAVLAGGRALVGQLGGFSGVFWRTGGLAYALIADLPRDHLLALADEMIRAA